MFKNLKKRYVQVYGCLDCEETFESFPAAARQRVSFEQARCLLDAEAAARYDVVGQVLHRWEEYIEVICNIRDIKSLALKIKDRIPPEWNEEFIEVEA